LSSYAVASDDAGNVTSDGLTTLNYNLDNHLNDRDLKGVSLDYTYTADGRLVRSERSDTGVVTEIVLDTSGRRLAKVENGVWRDYVHLGDQLLAYFDDGAAEPIQVIADHIGMPMIAVDGAGAVVWQAKAEPYGELRGEVELNADPGLRYPGQWQDELDLESTCIGDTCTMPGPLEDSFSIFENGYRWYDPGWGRYGQGDPKGIRAGVNLYGYAFQNPGKNTDRFGLECDCVTCPKGWWIGVGGTGSAFYKIVGVGLSLTRLWCPSGRLECEFFTFCGKGGVGMLLGIAGGPKTSFFGLCEDEVSGWSFELDADIPVGSAEISIGKDGTLDLNVEGGIQGGGIAAFNVCHTWLLRCEESPISQQIDDIKEFLGF
jgi:RHS repeat-associated protein